MRSSATSCSPGSIWKESIKNDLLIFTPAAVKTELQRQHISKELIEYGFAKARELGFGAVIVEGNPQNYRARGFVTAADHGILPGKSAQLPAIECLMVKELILFFHKTASFYEKDTA